MIPDILDVSAAFSTINCSVLLHCLRELEAVGKMGPLLCDGEPKALLGREPESPLLSLLLFNIYMKLLGDFNYCLA